MAKKKNFFINCFSFSHCSIVIVCVLFLFLSVTVSVCLILETILDDQARINNVQAQEFLAISRDIRLNKPAIIIGQGVNLPKLCNITKTYIACF